MTPKLIKSERNYRQARARVAQLMDAREGTPEADELELLALLVEKYEQENFPIAGPNPIDAIRFRMEQMGYARKDLARVLHSKSRATEILDRPKYGRGLSLAMIQRLHRMWRIPAEILIQETPPRSKRAASGGGR